MISEHFSCLPNNYQGDIDYQAISLLSSGFDTRLLAEPDPGVEVPVARAGGQADRPLVPGALPRHVPRRRGHRHRRRRRDTALLERLLQGPLPKGELQWRWLSNYT